MRKLLALTALIFFLRNALLPLAADDYSYAFVWDGAHVGNILYGVSDSIERVHSIDALIQSQWSHYMTWGGRTPAHTLIQIFVWAGKGLFDVLNTAMFVAMIVLISKLAAVRLTLRSLTWIGLGLWIAVPEWISTMQWLTGACNYLWMGVFQLLFIYLIARTPADTLRVVLVGLIAGWSNEVGGAVTFLIVLALIVRQKKIRAEQSVGLIFFLIGFALLIFAPGNFNRLRLSHPDFEMTLSVTVEHLHTVADVLGGELFLLFPIAICLSKTPRGAREIKLFLTAGLLVPLAMIFSPEFPLRSCFMSAIFLLIASTAALDRLGLERWELRRRTLPLTLVGVMWTLSVAGSLYSDVSIYRQMSRRLELIDARRSEDVIEVPPLNPTRRLERVLGLRIFGEAAMSIGGDLSDNPRDGHNATFAKYCGVKAVVVRR